MESSPSRRRVVFVGAGPGDPDLITVKGARALASADTVLVADSLVPQEVISRFASPECVLIPTASLTLEAITEEIVDQVCLGRSVVRVHSGDLSIYSAAHEQAIRLRRMGIEVAFIPGVPSFALASALFEQPLTLPRVAQTVVLTRTGLRSSPMPLGEDLITYAQTGATIVIHLGITHLARIVRTLRPVLGEQASIWVGFRLGWPDELLIRGTLSTIQSQVKKHKITRTAIIVVGRVLSVADDEDLRSALYDPNYRNLFRKGSDSRAEVVDP